MKMSLAKLTPMLLGSIALTAQAGYIPFDGQINIQAGSVVLTPNVLGAVTAVGSSTDGKVTSVSGVYPTSLDGQTVMYEPFAVGVGSQPVTDLWTIVDPANGFDYTFSLSSITSVVQTSTNLFLDGTGVLASTDPTLEPTSGLWTYGINSANGEATNGIFSFQSNNSVLSAVPDQGNTFILVGLGLIGLIGITRRSHRRALPLNQLVA